MRSHIATRSARFWLGFAVLTPLAAVAAETDSLRTAETAAGKWVDLRTEIARLDSDWATQKPLIESFIKALGDRTQTLEHRRDYLVAKGAKDTEELNAIEASNRAGLESTQAAEARIDRAVAQLVQMRPWLPPRLSAALEMPYRSLARPDATVNERMQLALTVLNRCLVFNRDISYGQEILTVPGEDGERLLEVVYWGLGQGLALDRNAGKAWRGRPEAKGWAWQPQPDAVDATKTLMAVVQGKANPSFIRLPAQVDDSADSPR